MKTFEHQQNRFLFPWSQIPRHCALGRWLRHRHGDLFDRGIIRIKDWRLWSY